MTATTIDPSGFRSEQLDSVFEALGRDGATVRLVGGSVRNLLLGEEPGDVDLAIDVPPDETVRLLEEAEISHRDFGIKFGTVMAVPGEGQHFEITSLREDIETDGRWAVVSYGVDWTADACRRDFTMNALYADPDGLVHDPLGGMADVLARRVRFVGDAEERIREDALRILRYYRFLAYYGQGDPDLEAGAACGRLRCLLETLSRFRVGQEMRKLLGAPDPSKALALADREGVLEEILTEPDCKRLERLIALEQELEIDPDWYRRWLAVDSGDVEQSAEKLNLARYEEKDLVDMEWAYESSGTPLEQGYRFGSRAACNALLVKVAAGQEQREGLEGRLANAARGSEAHCPMGSKDLLDAGWEPGPELGRAQARAEALWLEGDMKPDCAALLKMLKEERND